METTSWTYILNGGIRVLLTEASQAGLDEAALLLLSNRHNHLLPTYWSASLARAFLATGDEDALVAVLFRSTLGMSSHQVRKSGDWSSAGFSALLHIQRQAHTYGKSADGVLKSVLVRLKRERIGVPQVVASELNSHTDDQEIDSMLKLLGEIHDCRGNVWPRRAIDTRLQELLDNRLRQAAEGGVHNRIEALESAYDAHLDSGLCKRTLLSDLAVALAEAGRAERLRALLAEARGRNVVPFPGLADKIVAELLRLELVDEATELVLEMGGGAGMNFRTAARLCQALVERDRIEDAKRILKPKTDYHESAEKSVHLRPVMTQVQIIYYPARKLCYVFRQSLLYYHVSACRDGQPGQRARLSGLSGRRGPRLADGPRLPLQLGRRARRERRPPRGRRRRPLCVRDPRRRPAEPVPPHARPYCHGGPAEDAGDGGAGQGGARRAMDAILLLQAAPGDGQVGLDLNG